MRAYRKRPMMPLPATSAIEPNAKVALSEPNFSVE